MPSFYLVEEEDVRGKVRKENSQESSQANLLQTREHGS